MNLITKLFIFTISINSITFAIAQGITDYKPGGADVPVSGGVSANGSVNAAPSLETCSKVLGTIAVIEPQDSVAQALQMYKLPPPTQLLRMMIQQSKCFQVVERGMAMKNIMQERALASGGQLQQGQNIGGGQMIAADFLLTPTVQFSESNTGGAGIGAIGGVFGPIGSIVGAIAGGIKNKQAQTSIIISDARSGLQLAAAEGNVEKADFALGGVIGGVGAGAYSNTAEGKIVAAALLDNYNNVVKTIKDLPQLADSKINAMSTQNANASPEANAFVNGEVLRPKIAGIQILATPLKGQKVVEKIAKDGEMLFLGEEKNGFLKVQSSSGEGWIDKNLVKR